MKTLSIKNLVEFRSKSDKSKKSFASEIKKDKKKENSDSGGDYWISCLSAIGNSYKSNDLQFIIDKQTELKEKANETEYARTRIMYKRNIDILNSYDNLDFKKWRPSKELYFMKKSKYKSILSIQGLQLIASPRHVFTFTRKNIKEVGAIWFIAKLGGFKRDELGMFTEILYKYLKINFLTEFNLNSKYCIAVDVVNGFEVNYFDLEVNKVSRILNNTLNDIKKLM